MFANPLFWKKEDRSWWMVPVFALASALIALVLKARIPRIQRASGWSIWVLGALVPLCGHFLVSFGLNTGILVWDKIASESWAEVLIKSYVILPLVELMFTLISCRSSSRSARSMSSSCAR
jgi:hypothetical protein